MIEINVSASRRVKARNTRSGRERTDERERERAHPVESERMVRTVETQLSLSLLFSSIFFIFFYFVVPLFFVLTTCYHHFSCIIALWVGARTRHLESTGTSAGGAILLDIYTFIRAECCGLRA